MLKFLFSLSMFLQLNRTNSGKNDDNKGNKGAGKNEGAEGGKTAVVFSLKNEVGGLVKALRLFQVKVLFIQQLIYWKSLK